MSKVPFMVFSYVCDWHHYIYMNSHYNLYYIMRNNTTFRYKWILQNFWTELKGGTSCENGTVMRSKINFVVQSSRQHFTFPTLLSFSLRLFSSFAFPFSLLFSLCLSCLWKFCLTFDSLINASTTPSCKTRTITLMEMVLLEICKFWTSSVSFCQKCPRANSRQITVLNNVS